jgi:hypothetical protein
MGSSGLHLGADVFQNYVLHQELASQELVIN